MFVKALLLSKDLTYIIISMGPNRHAFTGFLFIFPFLIANFIANRKVEPFYSILHSITLGTFDYFLPLLFISIIPIGALIALKPVLKKGKGEKRKMYGLNILTALFLVLTFVLLLFVFTEEIYRCDGLKLPNCD